MGRVRAEVRFNGSRTWELLVSGTVNQTGRSDREASTFDSEEEADEAVESLAASLPEWWESVDEWRAVEAPRTSGPTQPEIERTNEQVKLRLPRTATRQLDALAKRWGLTRSDAVLRMIREHS